MRIWRWKGGVQMKSQATGGVVKEKRILIGVLYAVAFAIAAMGIAFTAYSLLNQVELTVLQQKVPGAAFGAVVAFLGIRYLLSVRKLKGDVYKTTSQFSWSNFKKH